MKQGDPVMVTFNGSRVPATVHDPCTETGAVLVILDKREWIEDDGGQIPILNLYRRREDVEPLGKVPWNGETKRAWWEWALLVGGFLVFFLLVLWLLT